VTDILDVVHCLRLKAQNVLENGFISIFRWKGRRRTWSDGSFREIDKLLLGGLSGSGFGRKLQAD
jgi:hypothetical protein